MLHHSLINGDEADDFGATPVHDAAEQGQLESLQVFYEHSVNMEIPDCDGLKPMYAPVVLLEAKYWSCDTTCLSPRRGNKNIFIFTSSVAMYCFHKLSIKRFLVVYVVCEEFTHKLLFLFISILDSTCYK